MLTGARAAKAMKGKTVAVVRLHPWGRLNYGTGRAHDVRIHFTDGSVCQFSVQETEGAADYGVTPHYHEAHKP